MGSPDFAVPSLEALCAKGEVVAVVCQPDRPAGRGMEIVAPPIKRAAQERGLRVLQPESLRPERSSFVQELIELAPDLVVVVAYGKILPQPVLAVPRWGCWNVHASLLPAYRGAAPIQWALIRGERVTGVTLMQMDAGMDTGPMILQRELPIADEDTSGSLHQKLARLGAEVLAEGLQRLLDGTLPPPQPQDERRASRAPLLIKEHGRVDFTRPAQAVCGQMRGVDPWPGAFTTVPTPGGEVVLKLYRPKISSGSGRPGEVLGVDRDGLHVACGQGVVSVAELQLPGRRRLPATAVLAGFPLERGTILGNGLPNKMLDIN